MDTRAGSAFINSNVAVRCASSAALTAALFDFLFDDHIHCFNKRCEGWWGSSRATCSIPSSASRQARMCRHLMHGGAPEVGAGGHQG